MPFDAVVTFDDVTRLKPDPQAYLVAMERLGAGPTGTVAVEDPRTGLLSAIAAGVPCVVVRRGKVSLCRVGTSVVCT